MAKSTSEEGKNIDDCGEKENKGLAQELDNERSVIADIYEKLDEELKVIGELMKKLDSIILEAKNEVSLIGMKELVKKAQDIAKSLGENPEDFSKGERSVE